jgi:hypothetical protein
MKRIISKIMLLMVLINGVPMHMHCVPVIPVTWGDTFKSAARIGLQGLHSITKSGLRAIAKNPGWASLVAGGVICNLAAFAWYKKRVASSQNSLAALLKAKNEPQKKEVAPSPNIVIAEDAVPTSPYAHENDSDAAHAHFQAAASSPMNAHPEQNMRDHSDNEETFRTEISNHRWNLAFHCSGITLATAAFGAIGFMISKACRWAGSRI